MSDEISNIDLTESDEIATIDLTDSPPAEAASAEDFEPVDDLTAVEGEGDDPADLAVQIDPLDGLELTAVLEAVLIVVEDPVPAIDLATRLERPLPDIEAALAELARQYADSGRGFVLREVAGGWRFYSRPEYSAAVERFVLGSQTARLSQAALETLAVVAYQQPVSRSRVAAVRGVSVDGVMRTLVSRGLVEESGVDDDTGAMVYRTTARFLEKVGLRDLTELPPLAPLLPGLDDLPEV